MKNFILSLLRWFGLKKMPADGTPVVTILTGGAYGAARHCFIYKLIVNRIECQMHRRNPALGPGSYFYYELHCSKCDGDGKQIIQVWQEHRVASHEIFAFRQSLKEHSNGWFCSFGNGLPGIIVTDSGEQVRLDIQEWAGDSFRPDMGEDVFLADAGDVKVSDFHHEPRPRPTKLPAGFTVTGEMPGGVGEHVTFEPEV